ncbi:MAG TPA: endolytic transglycosylase MltG [Acidimicrobiales bacterium]|nr:endolytic transglycosylase MltG [Acidimicrobiales bacterium]
MNRDPRRDPSGDRSDEAGAAGDADRVYIDQVGPMGRKRRWPWVLLAMTIVGLLLLGLGAVVLQRQIDPPGDPGAEVAVSVPLGTSVQGIASILDEKGVISNAKVFRYYARLKGIGGFQAGQYTLRQRTAYDDVISALRTGPKIDYQKLTVPEGLRLEEIADRVAKLPGRDREVFLAAARSGEVRSAFEPDGSNNLEGLLFPDTYFVDKGDSEREILERMVQAFDDAATKAGVLQAEKAVGLSPYEAVVVASLIEREAKLAADQPKVSQVIANRLAKGMLLQIDATVLYAIGHKERVLFKDLEVDSPYNTYKVKGLPPTPIAAPGITALRAAVHPEPGPWIYYVVIKGDGTHAFAETAAQHAANIRLAEKNGVR